VSAPHRVVILGGGFGGLYAAKSLRRAPVDVTVLDRRNFHLFQPLLYQVATGALSPGEIASPLRAILRKQKNTRVLLGDATDLDAANRRVICDIGPVEYDTLIVAAGARNVVAVKDLDVHTRFGHPARNLAELARFGLVQPLDEHVSRFQNANPRCFERRASGGPIHE
jgi:NADH dehydrogenase FAD-containing subunit